jgi:hypothetical protein
LTGVVIYNAPGTGVTMSIGSLDQVSNLPDIFELKEGASFPPLSTI